MDSYSLAREHAKALLGTKGAPSAPAASSPAPGGTAPAAEATGVPVASQSATPAVARSRQKEQIPIDDIILPTDKQLTFSRYSSIAVSYINMRTPYHAWDFIKRVNTMLGNLGYSAVDLGVDDLKLPTPERYVALKPALDKLNNAADQFANDVKAEMAKMAEEAKTQNTEIYNFEARATFGKAISHFLADAINRVGGKATSNANGEGKPIQFRPANHQQDLGIKINTDAKKKEFLAIADKHQAEFNRIHSLSPDTMMITPRMGANDIDVHAELAQIQKRHPADFAQFGTQFGGQGK